MTDQILSADILRITPAEHAALIEVRAHFAAGTFYHDHEAEADKPDGFNMDYADCETDCGTTCCIGGWMFRAMQRDRTIGGHSANEYVTKVRSDALSTLFHPPCEEIDDMAYADITPGAALKAIDSFLTTADPNWYEACGLHSTEEA